MNMLVYLRMNKLFQRALTGLLLLVPAALAVELSDLSPSLTRNEADENLTKDYAYRVLSDLSIRRIWNLDDNRKLTIDFDAKTGKLICIAVDYRKAVSLKKADRDAADIGKFDEADWKKFSAEKAAKYFMERSRAMKFKEGYMFQELNAANKCTRLTFYTQKPKENRRLISEGSTVSGNTAMGSSGGGNAVKLLLQQEETRLYTPNKTDKPKTTVKQEEPEPIEDEEEPEDEEIEDIPDEPAEDEVDTPRQVAKTPAKPAPAKPVTPKGDRSNDFHNLLVKLGLDKVTAVQWIFIGIGLVILITVISAINRNRERRKVAERAAKLRRGTDNNLRFK